MPILLNLTTSTLGDGRGVAEFKNISSNIINFHSFFSTSTKKYINELKIIMHVIIVFINVALSFYVDKKL